MVVAFFLYNFGAVHKKWRFRGRLDGNLWGRPQKGVFSWMAGGELIGLSTKRGVFVDGRRETHWVVHKKGRFRGRGGKISAFVLKIGCF